MVAVSQTTQTLLGLPRELRIYIYEMVLEQDMPPAIVLHCFQQPIITRGCGQIRKESLSVFLSLLSEREWRVPLAIPDVRFRSHFERVDHAIMEDWNTALWLQDLERKANMRVRTHANVDLYVERLSARGNMAGVRRCSLSVSTQRPVSSADTWNFGGCDSVRDTMLKLIDFADPDPDPDPGLDMALNMSDMSFDQIRRKVDSFHQDMTIVGLGPASTIRGGGLHYFFH